jgi:hypothetical protein
MVAVSGIMATMPPGPPFGERYIANAMFPEPTVTSVIKPLGVSNRAVQEDALIVGELVTTTGEVKATTGGGDFTISDGYYKAAAPFNTTVVVAGDPIAPVSVGEVVAVTGVVSLQVGVGGPERVIIYRSVSPLRPPTPPFSWSTGFEPGEGYVLGPLVPQNGWTLEASGGPTPGSATVVAARLPEQGRQPGRKRHRPGGAPVRDRWRQLGVHGSLLLRLSRRWLPVAALS